MPNHRFVLTLAVSALIPFLALAQQATTPEGTAPSAPPSTGPTEAEKSLDEAIAKVKQLKSFRARVHQEVDMLGQSFQVDGEYLKGPDYRIRLELTVSGLPETEGRLVQRCDGQTLWDYSNILGQEFYGRMELRRVLDRLNSPEFEESVRQYYIRQQFGLSGPEAMLEGLREAVNFDVREEGELNGKPVWILRGRWEDMTPLGLGPMAQIPAYIPSLVVVWVGKEDGWPYQVQMQGKKRPVIAAERKIQLGPDGRPIGNITKQQEEPPSSFVLQFEQVELNPTIADSEFFFAVAPSVEPLVRDTTADRLAELENASKIIAAQKQAEAARGEGPGALLNQGIDVSPSDAGSSSPTGLPAPAPAPPGGTGPQP